MPLSAAAPAPEPGPPPARGLGRRPTPPKPFETPRGGPKDQPRRNPRSSRPTSPAPILLSVRGFASLRRVRSLNEPHSSGTRHRTSVHHAKARTGGPGGFV